MKFILIFGLLVAALVLLKVTPHYHCWGPEGGLFVAASDMTGECRLKGALVELRKF